MASACNAQFTDDEFEVALSNSLQHFRHISGLKREQKLWLPLASLSKFFSDLAELGACSQANTGRQSHTPFITKMAKIEQQQHDIKYKENSEKIQVPVGIWTRDPLWSSRMF